MKSFVIQKYMKILTKKSAFRLVFFFFNSSDHSRPLSEGCFLPLDLLAAKGPVHAGKDSPLKGNK